jgi:hypothetical protein
MGALGLRHVDPYTPEAFRYKLKLQVLVALPLQRGSCSK